MLDRVVVVKDRTEDAPGATLVGVNTQVGRYEVFAPFGGNTLQPKDTEAVKPEVEATAIVVVLPWVAPAVSVTVEGVGVSVNGTATVRVFETVVDDPEYTAAPAVSGV